jgi:hypothetical protein
MAKKSKNTDGPSMLASSPFPGNDEYQTREDVDRLMRADEVHSDKGRFKRAHARISGVAERLKKRHEGRSSGRSGGR